MPEVIRQVRPAMVIPTGPTLGAITTAAAVGTALARAGIQGSAIVSIAGFKRSGHLLRLLDHGSGVLSLLHGTVSRLHVLDPLTLVAEGISELVVLGLEISLIGLQCCRPPTSARAGTREGDGADGPAFLSRRLLISRLASWTSLSSSPFRVWFLSFSPRAMNS